MWTRELAYMDVRFKYVSTDAVPYCRRRSLLCVSLTLFCVSFQICFECLFQFLLVCLLEFLLCVSWNLFLCVSLNLLCASREISVVCLFQDFCVSL